MEATLKDEKAAEIRAVWKKLVIPDFNSPNFQYPPCCSRHDDERVLYKQLQSIYERHSDTWDDESKRSWFKVIDKANLSRSTVQKVTSHLITRDLTHENITWAHVVALRVIFGDLLYTSKKILRYILIKYPNANFETHEFDEKYRHQPGQKPNVAVDKAPSLSLEPPGGNESDNQSLGNVQEGNSSSLDAVGQPPGDTAVTKVTSREGSVLQIHQTDSPAKRFPRGMNLVKRKRGGAWAADTEARKKRQATASTVAASPTAEPAPGYADIPLPSSETDFMRQATAKETPALVQPNVKIEGKEGTIRILPPIPTWPVSRPENRMPSPDTTAETKRSLDMLEKIVGDQQNEIQELRDQNEALEERNDTLWTRQSRMFDVLRKSVCRIDAAQKFGFPLPEDIIKEIEDIEKMT